MNYKDHKVVPKTIYIYINYMLHIYTYISTYLNKLNSFMNTNKKNPYLLLEHQYYIHRFFLPVPTFKHHHKVWKKDHLTLKLDSPCIKLCFMMPMWKVDDSQSKEEEKKTQKKLQRREKKNRKNLIYKYWHRW